MNIAGPLQLVCAGGVFLPCIYILLQMHSTYTCGGPIACCTVWVVVVCAMVAATCAVGVSLSIGAFTAVHTSEWLYIYILYCNLY